MRPILSALSLTLLLAPNPGAAASFNCTKTGLAPDEKAICANRDLNDADVRMVTTLHLLAGLFAMGVRGNMMDDQASWLKQRQACKADVACIRDAYKRRQGQLDQIYNNIDRPI
ncbi:lysozyme inhibitor LprI family protein [Paracoccus aminophilus]|uniref:Lysozyme inhibitor LprI N-terminal domain-containing protein n=1 Tax=Paracoccus aminophilus JCM 7686 TaxID=1367847 RepID=S5Y8L1_PARAH|nr:hypothetical protein [Paracoccus aminophilus]AGT07668.1 hypothetical protein JCM7686_0559 [Paracoccus aminophilus JCM 7686]